MGDIIIMYIFFTILWKLWYMYNLFSVFFFLLQEGLGDYTQQPLGVSLLRLKWIVQKSTYNEKGPCFLLITVLSSSEVTTGPQLSSLPREKKPSCLGQLYRHASETHKHMRPCSWWSLNIFIKCKGLEYVHRSWHVAIVRGIKLGLIFFLQAMKMQWSRQLPFGKGKASNSLSAIRNDLAISVSHYVSTWSCRVFSR